MGKAEVISLTVRPVMASHLCFEKDGILEYVYRNLGDPVMPFNFPSFSHLLLYFNTKSGEEGRLKFDANEIRNTIEKELLAELRSVQESSIPLQKAINARQNSYLSRYRNIGAIGLKLWEFYSPESSGSKPQRLAALSGIAADMWEQLRNAYSEPDDTIEPDARVKPPADFYMGDKSGVVKAGLSHTFSFARGDSQGLRGNIPAIHGRPVPDEPVMGRTGEYATYLKLDKQGRADPHFGYVESNPGAVGA